MKLLLGDCTEVLSTIESGSVDTIATDPPYGIGIDRAMAASSGSQSGGMLAKKGNYKPIIGDETTDTAIDSYNVCLSIGAKKMILWGGNYFVEYLKNTRCFLVWDKMNGTNSMADCELAWTSFEGSVRKYSRHIFTGIGNSNYKTIHPTQKPVKLYEWLLTNYAKPGDKILDTHLGSGSIAVACNNLGFQLCACELDTDYFNMACERIKRESQQERLF